MSVHSLNYYRKAFELTDAMIKADLVTQEQGVYRYSLELQGEELELAKEAVGVCQRIQICVGFATKITQAFCVLAVGLMIFY